MTETGVTPAVELDGQRGREAAEMARSAAARAGVTVHDLHELDEVIQVVDLFNGIWRPDERNPLVTIEQLRAMTHAGNYLSGAVDVADPDRSGLLGACVGFFAAPPGTALHSHIAGVAAAARGRSVGFALKLHQRAWALERGLTEITWTFDPLVRRNAYFNLVKLGARPREYLVDFYGEIDDAINAGQGTDRLLMAWELEAPGVIAACRGERTEGDLATVQAAGGVIALAEADGGRPDAAPKARRRQAGTALVQIPRDIEDLRRSDPAIAREWRSAVRDVLGELIAGGARVTGFLRSGWYVVERMT